MGYEATDFYDKEIAKLSSNHPLLAVITINSVLKINESYYLQAFFNKCKFIEKKKTLTILLRTWKFFVATLMKNKLVWVSFLKPFATQTEKGSGVVFHAYYSKMFHAHC